ncbi:hypothetical protein R3P38DRAFT_2781636 [Favolaschia claudopus]|uniref:Uncharacterized protein n=1 Tax=Favolaschia claudopus TaxID=2862362 RepID=A0AAW0B2L4_9AGAR
MTTTGSPALRLTWLGVRPNLAKRTDDAENDGWLGPEVNGSKTIKVTLTEDQMMLWNGGDWAFPPNQNIRVAVSLERYDGSQSYIHTYIAWIELFQVVTEWELN